MRIASSRTTMAFQGFLLGAALLLASTAAPSSARASAPQRAVEPPRNVLAGKRFFVDPYTYAQHQLEAWKGRRPAEAKLIQRIASQPQAIWFGDWDRNVYEAVRMRIAGARAQRTVPVLAAYNIPGRDCGSYSGGGAASAAIYRRWIQEVARAIGKEPAVVILEPDALAQTSCLSARGRSARLAMLREAVGILKSSSQTRVYLDAGNPGWLSAGTVATQLREAGIEQADGFALNVSNFFSNEENIRYGSEISALVGGKHFVIDTSRNGRGSAGRGAWCNPSGRALGTAPTSHTGHPLVDAYLWIHRPGQSDGTCNGGPNAGTWWPEYALALAR